MTNVKYYVNMKMFLKYYVKMNKYKGLGEHEQLFGIT